MNPAAQDAFNKHWLPNMFLNMSRVFMLLFVVYYMMGYYMA